MAEERDNIIVLIDDKGEEFRFEILDVVEYNNNEYAVGLDANVEDDGEEDTVLIMRIVHANEEEDILEPVEDENELKAVFEIFKEHMSEEFEFEEE